MNNRQPDAGARQVGDILGDSLLQGVIQHGVAAVFDDYRPSPPAVEFRRAAHVVYSPLILIYS